MVGYVIVGTRDVERAVPFYDALMEVIGTVQANTYSRGGRLYASPDGRMFGVTTPYDQELATVGNGTMIGFPFDDPGKVDRVFNKAIELGAKSEGEPGYRGDPEGKNYFAYFRDLDGNKLCVFCLGT